MIGLGVIGCGNIAYWTHLRIARRLRGARRDVDAVIVSGPTHLHADLTPIELSR